MPKIVYSPKYNIGLLGIERLHPFDSRKYGRAWSVISSHFGSEIKSMWIRPKRGANLGELLSVHTYAYLKKLKSARYVAQAIEIPQASMLPSGC